MDTASFRTRRLGFRPFVQGDLDALARLAGDPQVARYVGDGEPLDREAAALWISRSQENVARFGYGTGAVVDLGSARVIGWAGFARPDDGPQEIIYALEPASWGRGLGRELLAGLIAHAFDTLSLAEVRATTHPDNAVSQHMLLSAGFVRQPDLDPESRLFVLARPSEAGTPPDA